MDNYTLSKTQNLKYLGVILDHKVPWIQHISYVKNKISKGIGIMYKARRYLGSKSLVNLYHSYIYIYIYKYISLSYLLYRIMGQCCTLSSRAPIKFFFLLLELLLFLTITHTPSPYSVT